MTCKKRCEAIILDGYVDEPTALGVPPYISPYPRYVAGTLALRGIPYSYMTVDQWRGEPEVRERINSLSRDDLLVVIAGLTVPGRYKGGTPLTLFELKTLLQQCKGTTIVGGPIRHGYTLRGGTAALPIEELAGGFLVRGDLDAYLDRFLDGREEPGASFSSFASVREKAVAGAAVCAMHPWFPHVIAEIETARGCERKIHCSFCTEGQLERAAFRPLDHIVEEIAALYATGVRHFRLGKQPNLFAWPGHKDGKDRVVPAPAAIRELYRAIRSVAPDLVTLHIDNVNPGFVASFPDECFEIASTIASMNTPGDVAAMGVESADEVVQKLNHLKCSAAEALKAIEVINAAGLTRVDRSLPALLPGINILYGLPGESQRTYDANFSFLEQILERGLLIRRINVRQAMVFPGTELHRATGGVAPKVNVMRLKKWKRRVAEEIVRPMLKKVAPTGTIIRHVLTEYREGNVTFGRALGSYPLLVGIAYPLPLRQLTDVVVVDHGFRSVTALPWPIPVNTMPVAGLRSIPGVGARRAARIAASRPFRSPAELIACLDEAGALAPFVEDFTFDIPEAPP